MKKQDINKILDSFYSTEKQEYDEYTKKGDYAMAKYSFGSMQTIINIYQLINNLPDRESAKLHFSKLTDTK